MIAWTHLHFITLIPSIIVMIIISFILRYFLINHSLKARMIPFQLLAVLLLIIEIVKQIYSIKNGYNLYHLPFHVCSLFIFFIPLMAFYKGKYSNVIKSITCSLCIALLLFMLAIPNQIYSSNSIEHFFKNYLSFHTVLFHNIVIFEFILIVFLDLYTKNDITKNRNILFFGLFYATIAITFSLILKTNFSNFYYSQVSFLDNIRLLFIEFFGSIIGQLIYSLIVGLCHIVYFTLTHNIMKLIIYSKEKIINRN